MSIIPISSNPLISLSASYPYDNIFDLKPTYYKHIDTGYYGISNPLFKGIKDVKFINNSLFFISSAVNLGNVIDESTESFDVRNMVIYSGLKTNDGKYFKLNSPYILGTETNAESRSLFRFIKLEYDTYNIIDINNKYWTIGLEYPWTITLEDKIETDTYNQQIFTLEYIGKSIYIKTNFKNIHYPPYDPEYYERFVGIDQITGRIGAIGYVTDDKTDLLYEMVDFDVDSFQKGYDPDSIYVKYYNELEDPTNNKNIEFKEYIRNTKNNLLIDSPFKSSVTPNDGTMNVNIANLKNIQTPEYEYTKAPYFVDETITQVNSSNVINAIKRREYNQLFMGTNQERGYENPCLGFNSNTKEMLFKPDKITYFHYPKTAPDGVPIQNVGFVESGAVPSNTPAHSDKIWKKFADYEKNIWWGNSVYSGVSTTSSVNLPIQQGTWLCSWLSGNNNESVNGVWMDRWYYPGFVTIIDALTLDTMFLENTGTKVWDEPSQMTLDGGCWYKYFHYGDKENKRIVDTLANNGLTGLRIEYTDWNSETIEDGSIYKNDGIINNYSDTVVNDGVLNINGDDQFCTTPYNSSYKISDKISVVSRMKFSDWENIDGHHIISNGVNNGWNIQGTNGYFTPSLVVFEKTYGHLLFLNNDGDMYYDSLYPISAHPVSGDFYGTPTALTINGDLTIWATNNDPNYKRLYKTSYDGIINSQIEFDSSTNLTEVNIDKDKNVWVLDTSTNTASGFSPDLSLAGTITMSSISAVNRIDFDTQNNFLSGDYTILDRCIDADNNVFELCQDATYIHKNETNVYRADGVTNIACDSNGILWVLKDGNQIVKTTSDSIGEDKVGTVGQYTNGQRRIVFTNEYVNGTRKNYAWVLHSAKNKLFKVDENCQVDKEINLSDYVDILAIKFSGQKRENMVFDINGDSTGYEWQTKYNDHTPRIETQIILDEYLTGGISLMYPASNFVDDEYYNITFTYDSDIGEGNLYVNTLLVDTASAVNSNNIYFKHDNSMIIGGDMGNSYSLNEELDMGIYSVTGKINDLRIYDSVLNNFDIKHIELLHYNFQDMVWNMPVGVQSFVEEIERFFKHKLPGLKSQFYNIKLSHLNITNPETRSIIEEIIRETVKKVAPLYTELYKIIWE